MLLIPTEATKSFKEANINDLIFTIGSPVLFDFIRTTGRVGMQLEREREIISVDSQTGGTEEFVVVEEVSLTKDMAVFIIEAKRSSVGAAMKQVSLAMKDARDNNGGGVVYGFSDWRDLANVNLQRGGISGIPKNGCSIPKHG